MTTDQTAPALSPNEHAERGLKHLAARLEPIIAATLKPHLEGLQWTVLLQEIDRLKGKTPHTYSPSDVQPQLRMLTERLGSFGYPFDDHTRAVSTVAGELRIMRNRVYHMDEISLLDAWRALDFVVRLLARLGDADGSAEAETMRDGILRLTVPATVGASDPQEASSSEDPEEQAGDEQVEPDPEVFSREGAPEDAPRTALPNERLQFEPWTVVPAGTVEVLDHLKRRDHADLVRSVIEEIVEHEGPVHLKRLARLTGRALGLGRVEAKRVNQIKHQAKNAAVIENNGWYWPEDLDPATWQEFRPNSSSVDREFTLIAPQEIRNASRVVQARFPQATQDEHRRLVLQTFGKKRLTKGVKKHLNDALGA